MNATLKPTKSSQNCHLPSFSFEHAPEHLRPPVEEPGEDREHDAAEQRVVEVRDHEVAVVHLPVDRERGQVDPGEPADDEEREEAEREQHRRLEAEVPAPERGEPVEDLDPVGTAMTIDAIMKKACNEIGSPTVNMWCAHTSIEKKPIATVEATIAL